MKPKLIVAVDIETTGLDLKISQPVQLAAIVGATSGGKWTIPPEVVYNSYCNPTVEIEPEAQEVHQITKGSLKFSPSPDSVCDVMANLVQHLQTKADVYLVTYNGTSFDIPILSRYNPIFSSVKHIDMFTYVLRYMPEKGLKLTEVFKHYIGRELEAAHDAASDCLAVCELVGEVCNKEEVCLSELHTDLAQPKAYSVFPFGKHAGKPIDSVPKKYAKWCMENFSYLSPDLKMTLNLIVYGNVNGRE